MKAIKKYKFIYVIVILVVIIILLLIWPFKKEVSFDLKDKCGPIMNMISHTIKDEAACRSKCRSQCETKELSYSRVEFLLKEPGCNSCTCYCK